MKKRRLQLDVEVSVEDDEIVDPRLVAATIIVGYNTLLMQRVNAGGTPRNYVHGLVDPQVEARWIGEPEDDDRTMIERVTEVKESASELLGTQIEKEIKEGLGWV